MRILVLGGTGEARALAAALVADGMDVISSLAGRVQQPRRPEGSVRIGGFGGVDGLAAFLRDDDITAVVDATHPFAATITRNAPTPSSASSLANALPMRRARASCQSCTAAS